MSNLRSPSVAAAAVARTSSRYAGVRAADRHYVRIKLRTDPLTAELLQRDEPLGDVIDVGCGRGQFGLLLHELGRVDSLFGFDWDPAKIATAQAAANGCAQFVTADLRTPPIRSADTILVFDVLQYLSPEEQDGLLEVLAAALRPGGRMLIRSADRGRGWQARFSQMLERWGRALGVNRSHVLTFRPSEQLQATLESLGLRVQCAEHGRSALLDNRLWIAELAPQH